MASDVVGKFLKELSKDKSPQGLAKLLSAIDKLGIKSLKHKSLLNPESLSFRIGITGPPGAGKSTLVSALISEFRVKNMSVGVIAVDPSSPFSKGAILGDRIRIHSHFNDEKVFIRSIGSRGFQGGLNALVYLMLRAYDVYGFDVVLVETVGVGQTELEIMNVADQVAIVLVPESGDSIQLMKAGLLEIADVFVVNKSDRPGADILQNELKINYESVFSTIASKPEGVSALAEFFLKTKETANWQKERWQPERLQAEARAFLEMKFQQQFKKQVSRVKKPGDLKALLRVSN